MNKFEKLEKEQLVTILKDLYQSSEETRMFVDARLGETKNALNLYLVKLKKVLHVDAFGGGKIKWKIAKSIIKDYQLATGDEAGVAELMVTRVEGGNQFTLDYGDINEKYYSRMEQYFQDAVDHLLLMKDSQKEIRQYVDRLKAVVKSTNGIGWGYHDTLCDIYCEAFGDDL